MKCHTLMGVWIETNEGDLVLDNCMSHPVWVCGLKLRCDALRVAAIASHPVWVCGLKLTVNIGSVTALMSHPVWVCGLKLI